MNIIFFLILICVSFEETHLLSDSILDNYQIKFQNSLRKNKLVSCLSLVEQSIKKGNNILEKELVSTSLNKEEFYKKYVLTMLNKCVTNISFNQTYQILKPYFNFDSNSEYSRLIQIDQKINTILISQNEIDIENDILNVIKTNEDIKSKNPIEDKKSSYFSYVVTGFIIFFSLFLIGFYQKTFSQKKEKDPKKKEEEEEEIRQLFAARKRN